MPYKPNEPTRESLAAENTVRGAVVGRLKEMVSTGAAAKAASKVDTQGVKSRVDGAEGRALGPDGTYSEPGNHGSSIKR